MFCDDVREICQYFITQEVIVARQNLQFACGQCITYGLETIWTKLITRYVEFFEFLIASQCLCEQHTSIVFDDIAFDIEAFKCAVLFESFGDPLGTSNHHFIILDIEFLEIFSFLEQLGQLLACIRFDEVTAEIEHLEFVSTFDDWDGTFTFEVVLSNSQCFDGLVFVSAAVAQYIRLELSSLRGGCNM